ncbi:hypothetical protein [Amycolatopsis samaneae]|uniref:Uncharacterized protein n=1 Tax=Amycolatopsis samaneae TaxID=664691 RepID=A0ABW5GE25_9PSEU
MTVRLNVPCGWCGDRCRSHGDRQALLAAVLSAGCSGRPPAEAGASFWTAPPAETSAALVPVAPSLNNFLR